MVLQNGMDISDSISQCLFCGIWKKWVFLPIRNDILSVCSCASKKILWPATTLGPKESENCNNKILLPLEGLINIALEPIQVLVINNGLCVLIIINPTISTVLPYIHIILITPIMIKKAAVITVASIFSSSMNALAPRHDPAITDNLCFAKHVLQFINHIISNSEYGNSHCYIKTVYRSKLFNNTPQMRVIQGNWL